MYQPSFDCYCEQNYIDALQVDESLDIQAMCSYHKDSLESYTFKAYIFTRSIHYKVM